MGNRKSILIVNGDKGMIELYSEILAEYATMGARDGIRALELLASNKFDLILTDQEMPNMSGAELIDQCVFLGLNIPIVVASASKITHLSASVPEKPFDMPSLLNLIAELLNKTH